MDMEKRVRMLERRGRRQGVAVAALGLMLAAVFLMGQASPELVTTQRIVVQDTQGRDRIVLDGGSIHVRGQNGQDMLAFGSDQDRRLVLDDASIVLLGEGPSSTLSNGRVFLFQEHNSLDLKMQDGKPRVVLGEAQQQRAVLGPTQMTTSDGKPVMRPTGSLVLLDGDGTVTFHAP